MRFHVVHKLVTYLLAASAVGTLVSSGAVSIMTLAMLLVAGALSWFIEPGTRLGRLVERGGFLLNAIALAVFALSLFEVVRSFPEPDLSPILNLAMFLLMFKLAHRRTNRDYLQIYVLSFLVVLAGAWLAQTVTFAIGFSAYVVLSTWTLILFHLRHEIEDNYLVKHLPESATEKVTAARVLNSRRVVGRSFFAATGLVSLTVLLGAAMVFTFIPRIGLGFLSGAVRRRVSIVGFSDQVVLGHHGVLSTQNETVVLRAEVPRVAELATDQDRARAISTLYWRGTVYEKYVLVVDGGSGGSRSNWLRARSNPTRLRSQTFFDDGYVSVLDRVEDARKPGKPKLPSVAEAIVGTDRQVIQVIGLSFPVAFALDQPVAFQMMLPPPASFVTTAFSARYAGEVALQTVRMTMGGNYVALPEFNGGQYVAYSRRGPPQPGVARPVEEMQDFLRPYLDIEGLSPRIVQLARDITRTRTTPTAKVQAVVDWLRATHHYTTDLKRDTRIVDPLEDFLFNQDAGHCEYFATAAALLLRAAGVPTRYINGFLGGEWNSIGKHITIRDNRAHSWVEAYLGEFGWYRVDATPGTVRGADMSRIKALFDSVELFWSRWVLQYDASRQLDIARKLGKQLGIQKGQRRLPSLRPDRRVVEGVVLAFVLLVAARRLLRRPWRTSGGAGEARQRAAAPIFRLYQRTLDRLSARGFSRRTAETASEFAQRLDREQVPGAQVMKRLTTHYEAARYGDHDVPPGVLDELRGSVDDVGRPAA
jgi:transglutaminase-like putative cysteine protease